MEQLRILAFGAHPDDCDIKVGGTAAIYADHGHRVKFVSVTNGDAGHHEIGGVELAKRRYAETQAVADLIGIEYDVLDNHDGELEPTLENRFKIIRLIREFKPHLIFTHRPNDYHPDHRYTSILVQDAAYMITVPNICALTPHLDYNPTILYMSDGFQKPSPFQPNIAMPIDAVIEKKIDALHCHTSQFYEWLPFNGGRLDQVPESDLDRREWIGKRYHSRFGDLANKNRDLLISLYGEEIGSQIRYAEFFEVCEYGSPLSDQKRQKLFFDLVKKE